MSIENFPPGLLTTHELVCCSPPWTDGWNIIPIEEDASLGKGRDRESMKGKVSRGKVSNRIEPLLSLPEMSEILGISR